jgi:hypothetical protein
MWQRLVLASSLLFGLLIGVAGTVFGYSNLATVDVGWSAFHLNGIPLWTVAVVPVAIVLVAGSMYHWYRSLYHFTEHMRHRHRVHELEIELGRLQAQLDQLLEMPSHTLPAKPAEAPAHIDEPATPQKLVEPALLTARTEPNASNGAEKPERKTSPRKRVSLAPAAAKPEAEPVVPNGSTEATPSTDPARES